MFLWCGCPLKSLLFILFAFSASVSFPCNMYDPILTTATMQHSLYVYRFHYSHSDSVLSILREKTLGGWRERDTSIQHRFLLSLNYLFLIQSDPKPTRSFFSCTLNWSCTIDQILFVRDIPTIDIEMGTFQFQFQYPLSLLTVLHYISKK